MFIGNGGAQKTSKVESLLVKTFNKHHILMFVADIDRLIELFTVNINIANMKQVKQKQGEHLIQCDLTPVLQFVNKKGNFRKKTKASPETVVEPVAEVFIISGSKEAKGGITEDEPNIAMPFVAVT